MLQIKKNAKDYKEIYNAQFEEIGLFLEKHKTSYFVGSEWLFANLLFKKL